MTPEQLFQWLLENEPPYQEADTEASDATAPVLPVVQVRTRLRRRLDARAYAQQRREIVEFWNEVRRRWLS